MADPSRSDSARQPPRGRLAPDRADARFVRRVLILIVIVGVVAALLRAGDLLILAFGSILGAIVIHALADLYRDHLKVPAKGALALGMVTTLALIGFLIWLFAGAFRQQFVLLITRGPDIIDQMAAQFSTSPVGAKLVSAVRAAYAGSQAARDVSGLLKGGVEMLLYFLILLFGAFFFAGDPAIYQRGLLSLVPTSHRAPARDALIDVGETLKLWLRAQLIQMTTMGVMIGVGLAIVGVPSAPALGLLAGLSEFVPYVGPIAAMIPALGLSAINGQTSPILATFGVFVVVRLIQSNLITPFVTNSVISIPPAVTLFVIIGIGFVFGLFGLFFSAALLVVIVTLIRSLYLREVLGEPIPNAEPSDS